MPNTTFTDKRIRALATGKELRDVQLPGFGVRAHSQGASWFLAYEAASGQRRRLKLGTYPATSIKDARARAIEARTAIERGQDPAADRPSLTLAQAFKEYLEVHLHRLKAGHAMGEDIRRDIIVALGARKLDQITRYDIARVLDRVQARAPVQANRVLQYTKAMFRRFVERGLLDTSPAGSLRKRTQERPRDRVLSHEEIRSLWAGCTVEGSWFGPLIQLLLLTGMRRSEPLIARVAGAPTPEMLVLDDPKQGYCHSVVLFGPAMYVASQFYSSPQRPTIRRTVGWSRRWARLLHATGMPAGAFTIHDLRRTWATLAAKIGIDPLIIELCLGHSPSGVLGKVGAIYNRHTYAERCAHAWQKMSDHLLTIVGTQAAGTVAAPEGGARRRERG